MAQCCLKCLRGLLSTAHLCNVFFEKELEASSPRPLLSWLRSHPIVAQLQFLPLLYAGPEDLILVSDLPENPDPRLRLITDPPQISRLECWGGSQAVDFWAKQNGIPHPALNWTLLKKINSKIFSFENSPKLPNATLLYSKEQARSWLDSFPGLKVLKTPLGTAGNGHRICTSGKDVKQLYTWPVIGEPWVERVLDFSTQWEKGTLLGVTCFKNSERGSYKETFLSPVEPWALQEHLNIAKPLVQQLFQMGYEGPLGIDAFIYLSEEKKQVHPIVEINARKTMSWVAHHIQRNLHYATASTKGLLPFRLKTFEFSRNIYYKN